MPWSPVTRRNAAGVLGCAAFVLIGWSGLLVPSLIRSVKADFAQSDAAIGGFYFVFAVAYASGSLGGGLVTERLGRRAVLTGAAALHALGLAVLGVSPSWGVFLAAGVPAGLGGGAIDGGVNGLFLDLYRDGRGRALNLLHTFFSVGALSAPVAIGLLVVSGADWRAVVVATALLAVPVATLFATVPIPLGRRPAGLPSAAPSPRSRPKLSAGLVLLAVAIACYVASEVGVSSWLVRFLEPAPLTVATAALSLYWAGLTAGRLVAARYGDRFDHVRFATVSATAMAIALVGAIVLASVSLPLSIALFAIAGFASGPVFPTIVAVGGERYPDRLAAVSGFLTGTAVLGSIVYPPVMGVLSVTVGLTVAMLGNVALGVACAAALLLVARTSVRDRAPGPQPAPTA